MPSAVSSSARSGGALARLLTGCLGALLVLAGLAPTPSVAAPEVDTEPPLGVEITTLSPAVLGPEGPLTITGTVSNNSSQTWTDINMQPVTSTTPMTTSAQLQEAAATAADAYVGDRIYADGTFVTIDELEPGASQSFTIRVDREHLRIGSQPGVYWVGVHARGANPDGRDDTTDGRDRMFVSVVTEPKKQAVDATVVVPLRARVERDARGHLVDLDRWRDLLAPDGRLHDLFDTSAGTTTPELTWLVDPAVLEAVEQIAHGNPTDQLLVETDREDDPEPPPTAQPSAGSSTPTSPSSVPTPAPTASPTAVAVPAVDDQGSTAAEVAVDDELKESAATWLRQALTVLRSAEVLALPYGDVDVSGAAAVNSPLYEKAVQRTTVALERLQVKHRTTVSPSNGWLRPKALRLLDTDTTAWVSRSEVSGEAVLAAQAEQDRDLTVPTTQFMVEGHPVTAYESWPEQQTDDALTLRQRILAEAAVRRQAGSSEPLVVMLPNAWHPARTTDLTDGLDVPWLRWAHRTQGLTQKLSLRDLEYPGEAVLEEVTADRFSSADTVISQGLLLAQVVEGTSPLGWQVERSALTTLSTQYRDATAAAAEVSRRGRALEDLMGRIQIQTPQRVLLSSTSGQFPGTVENGLPVPVEVKVGVQTDRDLEVSNPGTLQIPANGRATLRFEARSSRLGPHQVTLVITDVEGRPTGSSATLPLRAASVSVVVWWLVAAGGAVLVLMILRQWRRRGLRRRADPLPEVEERSDAPHTHDLDKDQ